MSQTLLPILSKDYYPRKGFITTDSNKLAFEYIMQFTTKWGVLPFDYVLILHGEKLTGKTYLAKIWSQLIPVKFVPVNFSEFTELKEYKGVVVDEVNAEWREEALLHLVNFCQEHKIYLLLISRKLPPMKLKLQDLESRINSANIVKIHQPDDQLTKILIFKFFSDLSVNISSDVVDFLAKNLPRKIEMIYLFIKNLNQFALQQKRKVTVPLIKKFKTHY